VRVINTTVLVRAFASMFLGLPHRTTRNYKALLRQVGSEIFNPEHRLEPYYVSAFAHYRMEYFFRNQTLDTTLKPARYHLLMAYRLLTRKDRPPPRMNSHDMERYCKSIMESLWDDERCRVTFEAAADHIRAVAAGNMHRDNIRTAFTQNLNTRLSASQHFRSFWGAWRTIAGYEAIHVIRKGQACCTVGLLNRFILGLFTATN
jgi:hypothetical protein